MSKPVLGYWNLRGLAQPIRFMVAYLGLDIDEKRYAIDESGKDDWTKDKFNLGLDFPNLPYWKDRDIRLTETKAIIRYLAREKSKVLLPKDPEEARQADMLENVLWDDWFALIKTCLTDTDEAKQNLANNIPTMFGQLNTFLGGTNQFLLGDQVTFVDFIMYEVLFGYLKYDPTCLKGYRNLENFKRSIESFPAIAKYIASSDYIESPCFHPMYVKKQI